MREIADLFAGATPLQQSDAAADGFARSRTGQRELSEPDSAPHNPLMLDERTAVSLPQRYEWRSRFEKSVCLILRVLVSYVGRIINFM